MGNDGEMTEKKILYYRDKPMERKRLTTETYEYEMPFNYRNIEVKRRYYRGTEYHGVEMNPVNSIARDGDHFSADTITIREDRPIIRVAVIGSACTPPGYVQLEAEACESFYRPQDIRSLMPLRFRINGLWGMHIRADNCFVIGKDLGIKRLEGGYADIPGEYCEDEPFLKNCSLKTHYRENPLSGMSSAVFEIPESRKVIVSGGSEIPGWSSDNYPDDAHFSFRIIRVTILINT
jgi:hypothetical protein